MSSYKDGLAAMDAEKEKLQSKYDDLNGELTTAQRDMKNLKDSYNKLEKEANESKKLLEAKISQDEKESQSRKMLDSQVADLRNSLAKHEEALSAERLKFQGEIDAKKSYIDKLKKEKDELQESQSKLEALQSENYRLIRDLDREKEKGQKIQKLEQDLSALQAKLDKTEKSKKDTDASMYGLQKSLADANGKVSILEKQLVDVRAERDDLSKDAGQMKRQLQDLNHAKDGLVIEKNKLIKDLDDTKRQLSSNSFENEKLQKDLSQKASQIEKLRASIQEEIDSKVSKLSQEKEALETSERELKQQLEELNIQYETTKMQKDKMVREIEDLNHDIAREQKAALSAERVKNQIQQQYDSLKDSSERQRRDRSEADVAKRKLNASLETTKKELAERTDQLMALQRVINPKSKEPMDWSKASAETQKMVDLSKKLQDSEKARKKAEEARSLLEAQMSDAKKRWSKDLDEKDSKFYTTKRAILDDLAAVSSPSSPSSSPTKQQRPFSMINTYRSSLNPRNSWQSDRTLVENNSNNKENVEEKPDIGGKSIEELEELFATLQNSKNDLLSVYHDTSKNLVRTKELLADTQQEKTRVERELAHVQKYGGSGTGSGDGSAELSDLKVRLDTEMSRNEDLASSMKLYKGRAEEYYNRLESAETVVLKATRAEEFAKSQLKDTQESLEATLKDYRQADKTIMDLQSRLHKLEGEVEDKTFELSHARESHDRIAKELKYLNSRHNQEATESASSLEAMRGRYSEEIRSLSSELEQERQRRSDAHRSIKKMEREIEQLKNAPIPHQGEESWAHIKNQLEGQVDELSKANEESTLAYRDAQKRIGSLLSQVRTLRTTMNEITVDRDQLQKDKRTLEQRLSEVSERFEELAVDGEKTTSTPSLSGKRDTESAAAKDEQEIAELRAALKKQTEASSTVMEKLKATKDQLEQDQRSIEQERALNDELRGEYAQLEKEKNSLNLKIIDLEARLLGPKSQNGDKDVDYLQQKIYDLESRLNDQTNRYNSETKQQRNSDREIKDLQHQLASSSKMVDRLQDESSRYENKIARLTESLEDIQSSETNHRAAARRAEREARDAKERSLRLEKELEDWRSRFESLSANRQGSSFV